MVTDRQELVQEWFKSQYYTSWHRNHTPIFFIPKNTANSITIPADKKTAMLSPISYIVVGKPDKHLIDEATYEIDIVDPNSTINVEIDGVKQRGWFRETSGEFFKYLTQELYIDGYWLFVKMSKGLHTIQSHASCRSGNIRIDHQYEVIMK